MDKVIAWWTQFVNKMNEQGIPVPMIRANGKASITATLVVISSFLMAVPIIIMVATVITRIGGWFTLNEANQAQLMNAFSAAIQMHIAALGAYLGRGMQRGADGKVIVEKSSEPEQK